MTLLVCWGVFPVLALAACGGWGLLVQRAAGAPLPGALIAPLGLAAIVVVAQALTVSGATAELAPPAVALGALAGLVLGRAELPLPRRRRAVATASAPAGAPPPRAAARPVIEPWLLGAGLLVFAVMAAPVLTQGDASFAGYGVLGDTAVHFVAVDWLLANGRSVPSPADSAYQATLAAYLNAGYPTGAQTALGSLRPLVGQDVAWVFAPFLAVLAALGALALAPLAETVLPGRRRAVAAAVAGAGVPALAFAYVQEGSIKEIATIWVLALLGGLLPWFAAAPAGPRRAIPVAVAAAAALGVISVASAPWLGPLGLVLLAIALRTPRATWRPAGAAVEAAVFVALAVLLSLPALTQLGRFVDVVGDTVTLQAEIGNLVAPLDVWHALPVWPRGDFRLQPQSTAAWLLVALSGGAALLGVAAAALRWRRAWPLLAWLGASAIGWAYVTRSGSPWADAKALAILSPALGFLAALGAAALWEHRRLRLASVATGALLAAGLTWTLVLAGQAVPVAPRERLQALETLGPQLAGRGPVLYPQFEEFAKHFLRDGRPDSPAESYAAREVEPIFRPGFLPRPLGASYDLDDLASPYVAHFRTIVLRRGLSSFPPSIYRRVRTEGEFELWERAPDAAARWLGHLP